MADQENTVSVGSSSQQRRIVNLAPGIDPTDAVNVSQLTDLRYDLHRSLQDVRDEANAGVAAAIAMEAAPYVPWHITYAIGSGYYVIQGAIGVTFRGTAENGRRSIPTVFPPSEERTAVQPGVRVVLWRSEGRLVGKK